MTIDCGDGILDTWEDLRNFSNLKDNVTNFPTRFLNLANCVVLGVTG